MDTLNRILRHFKPIQENRLLKIFFNNRGEADPSPSPEPSPSPSPEPEPSPSPEPSWLDTLPEEARKDPEITKYKTADEFYSGYKNKVELIGKKGIIVPGENAPPEEKEKFLNSLGRPEKPEGYKLDAIENLHESIKVQPEGVAAFNSLAHKVGLTNAQANELNKWYLGALNESVQKQEKAETEAMQNAETALRSEWSDKYEDNKKAVANLILKAGGQEAIDAMGGVDGLGNNPAVLKALGTIAGLLSEDQINNIKGPTSQKVGNETKEEALKKIEEMNNNKENEWNEALWKEDHPKHPEAVAERQRLYKIAYAEG